MLLKFVKSNFFELILLTAFKGISVNKKREKVTKQIICVNMSPASQVYIDRDRLKPTRKIFQVLILSIFYPFYSRYP